MIALSAHLISVRTAAMVVDPEALASILSLAYREVADTSVRTGGQILPIDRRGLTVIWGEAYTQPKNPTILLRSAWKLMEQIEDLRQIVAGEHGLQVTPRLGVAMTNVGPGGSSEGSRQVVEGPETVIDRAHLLQRACLFYGSTMLLDDMASKTAAGTMEIQEIDRFDSSGEALLKSSPARRATMLSVDDVDSYTQACQSIHELLGPRGEVPLDRMGAVSAMQGAFELCRQGEWSKAAAVLSLLSRGAHPNQVARIYLERCRERAGAMAAASPPPVKMELKVTGPPEAPPDATHGKLAS